MRRFNFYLRSILHCISSSRIGALDGNKLEEQESLRFVPNVTLHNLCSTSRGVTWVTKAMYKNVLKPQGSWLYKQSRYIPHAMVYVIWVQRIGAHYHGNGIYCKIVPLARKLQDQPMQASLDSACIYMWKRLPQVQL